MELIVGLGNPGLKYKNTRHNVGFAVLDLSLPENEKWQTSKKAQAQYFKTEIVSNPVELLKPQTFMNNSGQSVVYAAKKHDLKPEDIIVIHDDIDLPLGKIRIAQNSSSGGNKGVQSIIDHLKSKNFIRLKIGIGPEERPRGFKAEKYVLKKFSKHEIKNLEKILGRASEAVEAIIKHGVKKAMNEFNG